MALLDNSAIEIMASGLGYPEGPVHCADGSILLVELMNQCLSLVPAGGGEKQQIADIPGSPTGSKSASSPNGLAVGKDGNLYICNSGGFEWLPVELPRALPAKKKPPAQTLHIGGLSPDDYKSGSLQRYDVATGDVEDVYLKCIDHGPFGNHMKAGSWPTPLFPLCGPDDLVVDAVGGIWFTDFGKQRITSKDVTGIYYVTPDGRSIRQMAYPLNSSNGIALSPLGDRLYVALTYERRIVYYDIPKDCQPDCKAKCGEGCKCPPKHGELTMNPANVTDGSTLLTDRLPGQSMPDSMAVDSEGNLYVATMLPLGSNPMSNGGITVISPDGKTIEFCEIELPEGKLAPKPTFAPMPSNICFGGKDMKTVYITCGASGYLISMPSEVAGLELNFGGSNFDASKLIPK